MGKTKNLFINSRNDGNYHNIEQMKQKILKEWWETDEYKKLKEKINQNKEDEKKDR